MSDQEHAAPRTVFFRNRSESVAHPGVMPILDDELDALIAEAAEFRRLSPERRGPSAAEMATLRERAVRHGLDPESATWNDVLAHTALLATARVAKLLEQPADITADELATRLHIDDQAAFERDRAAAQEFTQDTAA